MEREVSEASFECRAGSPNRRPRGAMGAALEAILNACSPVRFVVPHGKHLGCRADAGVVNNASDAEDRVRRMTPVAAPPEQQTQVATLSRAFEGMVLPSTQATP